MPAEKVSEFQADAAVPLDGRVLGAVAGPESHRATAEGMLGPHACVLLWATAPKVSPPESIQLRGSVVTLVHAVKFSRTGFYIIFAAIIKDGFLYFSKK